MACEPAERNARDILGNWRQTVLFFCLPIAAVVLTASPATGDALRAGIWTAALTVMGAACLVNARRCGRTHCFLTGPFFLFMAVVTLLYGAGVLPLGSGGWQIISLALLAGGVVLGCLPDLFLGKYQAMR